MLVPNVHVKKVNVDYQSGQNRHQHLRFVTDIDVKLFRCRQHRDIVVKWFVQFPVKPTFEMLLEYAHQPKRLTSNFVPWLTYFFN